MQKMPVPYPVYEFKIADCSPEAEDMCAEMVEQGWHLHSFEVSRSVGQSEMTGEKFYDIAIYLCFEKTNYKF